MAEQIPYGVTVSVINRLASLAIREFGRIYGVSSDLEKLKNTLELIQAELSDAEDRQHEDRAVQIWVRRLKQVLYDADNLFDELFIEDLREKLNTTSHGKVSGFLSSSYSIAFRHKVALEVENIRQQFHQVSTDMSLLRLNQRTIAFKENESAWRETSSFVLQSDIIGREDSKKDIIDLLKQTHTDENVSLIGIVGIGGLGKTALAQLTYNDAQVQKLFQKKMWVCVSEDFEVKTILHKMLESLEDDQVGNLRLDILQKKLRKELNGQRYLLVLDDVWNENCLKWNDLRAYLMCGAQGSKILVTTRNRSVTETMGISDPYVLLGLTKEQSWALLKNLTFSKDARRMSPNLVSIGERIAEKCKGVPLAIRTMGGLLRSKKEESDWWDVLYGDFWKLCEERDSIMPVLKLSYQNLPLGLRQCFAYCCLYPKGWEIKTDQLIKLWIAQGYLECSNETQSMEDVGTQYVKMLLMMSFFQEASVSEYNGITSFKMHDLMHDLAKLVAGDDCYLDCEGKGIVGKPMHVSFLSNCSLDSLDANKLRTVRSKIDGGFISKPSVLKNLKFLRVLDLSYSDLIELPESIDKLKHLRYLDLSNCKQLICLPKSICTLVCLQTLRLSGCDNLKFSVEIITKLISLRHFEIEKYKAFENMMPVGVGKLTSLQHLPEFVLDSTAKREGATLNELNHLDNIRGCLRIDNLGLVKDVVSESQEANLKAKKYIRRLELRWGQRGDLSNEFKNDNSDSLQLLDNLRPHQNLKELSVGWYPGLRFSSWLASLINIVEISLYGFFCCQHLPPLERLPWLKRLEICGMDELKYMHHEEVSRVFFPSLERLVLVDCQNLRGWQRSADVNKAIDIDNHLLHSLFPCLSYLEIIGCPNLTCMPTYPYLMKKLMLQSSSVKPMIETCLVQFQYSSFLPLSSLKNLQIGEIDMEAMPEEWMRNLTSLKRLTISRIPSIVPALQHMQQLPPGLEELVIYDVDKLDLWKDEENSLPPCHAPLGLCSLQEISIKSCKTIKALPGWIYSLQSLTSICIGDCHALESLPEAMRCFTNLQMLEIHLCPLLSDRCKTGTGVDWPKIAHIQRIDVDQNLNW